MKISKQEKILNRRKIVKTAVELFGESGYNKVTMRAIARAAEIGDATIYKYFPTKEKILVAYYEIGAEDTVQILNQIEDFNKYNLHEKIQVLLDTYLSNMLADREFVSESFTLLFQSPMFLFGDTNPIRKELHTTISHYLDEAFASEEITGFPFQSVLPDIICEYILGVLHFWIKDDSEEFNETTQFIDMTLNLGMSLLQSGIITHATDFLGFMIKSQMFRAMNPQDGIFKKMLNFKV